MGLFNFGKKKEETMEQCECGGMLKSSGINEKEEKSSCCCGGNCNEQTMAKAEAAKQEGSAVKVLGSGCAKCMALEEAVGEALKELGMSDVIEHVTDFAEIAAYGVMTTPALVVDGKVVSFGKALKKDEAVKILENVRGQGCHQK
ncbi:MAG: thioredoxin family protein [Erysipelotrichia bacterium]|nr:thioredoxin family protein [Erysipelotrichia bacterium]